MHITFNFILLKQVFSGSGEDGPLLVVLKAIAGSVFRDHSGDAWETMWNWGIELGPSKVNILPL